jgi:hypothetical protein
VIATDLLAFVRANLPGARPVRLLEIGAGHGTLARALAEAGYEALAIDPETGGAAVVRQFVASVAPIVATLLQRMPSVGTRSVCRSREARARTISGLGERVSEPYGPGRILSDGTVRNYLSAAIREARCATGARRSTVRSKALTLTATPTGRRAAGARTSAQL